MTRNQTILAVVAVVAAAAGVWFFILRRKDEESAPSVGPSAGDGGVVPSFGGGMASFAAAQPTDTSNTPGRKPSKPALDKKGVNGWGKGKPAGGINDGDVTPIRQGLKQSPKGPGGIVGTYRKKPEAQQPPPKVDAVDNPARALRQQYGTVTKLFANPTQILNQGSNPLEFGGKLQKKGIDPAGGFSPVVAKTPAPAAWTGGVVAARPSTAAPAATHRPAPKPAPPVKKAQLAPKKAAGKR